MKSTLCHDQEFKWAKARVHVYSDSVMCLGCMIILKRLKNGKARSENSNNPTSTQSCLESMENQLSSSEIFSQDSHLLRFLERSRKIWKLDKSRTIWGKNSIHVDVQRHWLDKKLKLITLYSEFQRSERSREKISAWTKVIPRCWKWRKMVWDSRKPERKWDNEAAQMTEHFKQSGRPLFRSTSALNPRILRRNTINFSADSGHIDFYFAQFTRPISSVSTEQFRVDVMIWLNRCLVRHPWERASPFRKRMSN